MLYRLDFEFIFYLMKIKQEMYYAIVKKVTDKNYFR